MLGSPSNFPTQELDVGSEGDVILGRGSKGQFISVYEGQRATRTEQYYSAENSEEMLNLPSAKGLTWVVVDGLPEREGDDLGLDIDPEGATLDVVRRACEDNGHCVGFAYLVDAPVILGRGCANAYTSPRIRFCPKEKGTGFLEDSCSYTTEKHPGQVWRWYYIRERAQRAQVTNSDSETDEPASTSLINHDAKFSPLPPTSVPPYLEAFGFLAKDSNTWRKGENAKWSDWSPRLSLAVLNHQEAGAHTWYTVEAALELAFEESSNQPSTSSSSSFSSSSGPRRLTWQAPRRLGHIRQFYSYLRGSLPRTGYDKVFVDTNGSKVGFALRGGLPGTTGRLNAWFGCLMKACNEGCLDPDTIAQTLHFLRAPIHPARCDGSRRPSIGVEPAPGEPAEPAPATSPVATPTQFFRAPGSAYETRGCRQEVLGGWQPACAPNIEPERL